MPSTKKRSTAWKTVEQTAMKLLTKVLGRAEGIWNTIASSTGRVGHYVEIQADGVAGNGTTGVVVEAKRRGLAKWITDAFEQLVRVAHENGRLPIFVFALNSDIKKRTVKTALGTVKLPRKWYAMPEDDFVKVIFARKFITDNNLDIAYQRELEKLLAEADSDVHNDERS